MGLTLTPVLGVQECVGLRGVLALQPVLIEGVQGGVDLRETDRQAAVGLFHLLDESFIHPAPCVTLCLTAAAQAPWEKVVFQVKFQSLNWQDYI